MSNYLLSKPKIHLLWALLLILQNVQVVGQERVNLNPDILNKKWEAKWITCPNVSLTDYGVYHFRKTFDLEKAPREFIIHVSGDNRYRLFVNGTEVCNGPARGDLANWRFETIDIAGYLKAGKNVLAAVVWNFAEYRPLAQITNKTAFIVQGDRDEEGLVNTGPTWKVYKNEAYSPHVKKPIRTVVGPGEEVNASLYPYGWELTDFNDRDWVAPAVLRNGFPDGKFTGWDWNLVPRNIPFMERTFQRIKEVERTENIVVPAGFPDGKSQVKIPANQRAKILLDQTFLTTAYPELVVSGGKGSSIEINYAEALVDEHGVKGNRNETAGKKMLSHYSDIYRPDGASKRRFQPLWFRTYRYIELTVETKEEPLVIDDLYGYFTAYPFEEKAYFKSSDSTLQSIWEVGWRTLRLCAGETFYDCPYYEQLQYVGDNHIEAMVSLYVSGDDRLMRNSIEQFYNSQLPSGLTQSRYPSYEPQVIPTFSLLWINMIHDYWMHRDDPAFVKKYLNGIRNVLYWYQQQIDKNGMLGSMDWWNFVDWAFGPWNGDRPIGGTPPGAIDGNSSIITLLYAYTLEQAGSLFAAFGDTVQANDCRELSRSLVQNTYQLCWSQEKGLIADTPDQSSFSQHANIMAVLAGMFKEDKEKIVMQKVLTSEDLVETAFNFKFFLVRAIVKAGMADRYLSLLGPWKTMIDLGLTTFAETPEPTRSDCHAWSAHPNYDLLATVCGIAPASPGFKSVNIEPHLGSLKFVECKMPHPKGDIFLRLKKKKKEGIEGEIILPEGLSGTFRWKDQKLPLQTGRQKVNM